jgi:hypothetical protein
LRSQHDKHDEVTGQAAGTGSAASLPLIPLEALAAGGTR